MSHRPHQSHGTDATDGTDGEKMTLITNTQSEYCPSRVESITRAATLSSVVLLFLTVLVLVLGEICLLYWPLYAAVYLGIFPEWFWQYIPLREGAMLHGSLYGDRFVPFILFLITVICPTGLLFAATTDLVRLLRQKKLVFIGVKAEPKYLLVRVLFTQIALVAIGGIFVIRSWDGYARDTVGSLGACALLIIALVMDRYEKRRAKTPEVPDQT